MYTEQKALNGTAFADVSTAAERIAEHTLANGGGTFNAKTGEAINDFAVNTYIVGGAQATRLCLPELSDLVEAVAAHIQHIPVNGDGEKLYFLGTWIEDGVVFIDSSEVVNGLSHAFGLARGRGELAIFDPEAGESIYII